jgi:hypothetical protein
MLYETAALGIRLVSATTWLDLPLPTPDAHATLKHAQQLTRAVPLSLCVVAFAKILLL